MKFRDLPDNQILELMEAGILDPDTGFGPEDTIPNEFIRDFGIRGQKAAESTRQAEYDALFTDEGGIFKYSTEFPTGPEGETKTYTWGRNKPLSPQDFEFMEQVRKRDFPEREPLEIKKTLVEGGEGSRKVFDYVVDNDLIEFPEGYTKEDKLAAYAAFPTAFREAAMGEESSSYGQLMDFMSQPGRYAMARLNDPFNPSPYEQAKTTSDMGDEWWKFPAKMAGDIVRSPTFPLALMGSALAPMPATMRGMMGREFTLGATEGIAEVEAARARKTMDPTLGDYALGGTLGGGLSAGSQGMILAAPKMLGAYKASRAAKQTPSLGEMWGQVRQDVANIPGNVFMDAAKERARNLLRTKPGSAYEPGARAKYSEKLGIPPDQLYPGLGMANRSSQQMTDMRTLATKNKKIHDWWTNSYDKLLTGINKWTNYENAPSVSQSGTIIENSLEDATNTFYDKLDVTYAKVLDDPAMGFQVDAQFDAARVGQMHKELDALKKKYEDKMEKELQYETIKESVPDDYGNLVIKEKKGDIKRDKQGNPILQQNSTLNPSEASELASAVKRIEGLRKSLNIRDAIAPGQNNEFVLNLNRGRSNLQKDIKNIPFMNRTSTGQSITADLRNLLSKHLTEATLAADPKIGAALVENNKLVDKFQTNADLLRKDLKNEARSSEDIGRSIMGNNTKMDALQYILGNYGKKGKFGEPIEFNRVRDSWFKNQVMRESPATGGISNKIAKPMGAHEEFVKKYYGPKVPFEDLQDYARGLLIIGDPQLIGLSGTLNQAGRDLANIPTSGRQALQYMQGLLKESTDPADLKKATKMIKDMEEANVIDFGASYAPKQPTTKLGTLVTRVGIGGTAARAPDLAEDQSEAPYSPKRSNFWKDQARKKY